MTTTDTIAVRCSRRSGRFGGSSGSASRRGGERVHDANLLARRRADARRDSSARRRRSTSPSAPAAHARYSVRRRSRRSRQTRKSTSPVRSRRNRSPNPWSTCAVSSPGRSEPSRSGPSARSISPHVHRDTSAVSDADRNARRNGIMEVAFNLCSGGDTPARRLARRDLRARLVRRQERRLPARGGPQRHGVAVLAIERARPGARAADDDDRPSHRRHVDDVRGARDSATTRTATAQSTSGNPSRAAAQALLNRPGPIGTDGRAAPRVGARHSGRCRRGRRRHDGSRRVANLFYYLGQSIGVNWRR